MRKIKPLTPRFSSPHKDNKFSASGHDLFLTSFRINGVTFSAVLTSFEGSLIDLSSELCSCNSVDLLPWDTPIGSSHRFNIIHLNIMFCVTVTRPYIVFGQMSWSLSIMYKCVFLALKGNSTDIGTADFQYPHVQFWIIPHYWKKGSLTVNAIRSPKGPRNWR